MLANTLATCIFLASQTYGVPPAVLVGILHVEGGKVGQQVRNSNGTYDLGPMQINTIWMPELARHWQVPQSTAKRWVRDDGCINVAVGAWILRKKVTMPAVFIRELHTTIPKRRAMVYPTVRRFLLPCTDKGC